MQIKVELENIPKDWEIEEGSSKFFDNDCAVYDGQNCSHCQGAGCYVEEEYLHVNFPKSGWITSYASQFLMFENNNSTNQFVEELVDCDIPYTIG